MYYVFFTKILQGGETASGIAFHKRCSRIVVKILDKYAYAERVFENSFRKLKL